MVLATSVCKRILVLVSTVWWAHTHTQKEKTKREKKKTEGGKEAYYIINSYLHSVSHMMNSDIVHWLQIKKNIDCPAMSDAFHFVWTLVASVFLAFPDKKYRHIVELLTISYCWYNLVL